MKKTETKVKQKNKEAADEVEHGGKKLVSIRMDEAIYNKICQLDPVGEERFTTGMKYLINEFFKTRN